ncbi:hypothetical protein CWB96_00105 [Pseudoalteromonas citrea]|uniref:Uncharacterized protein n=1 Tax=Pseudoalteromonas citrea TaxID=43655 RepID=A0A5S3XVD3_9GAMM|nr:hypothetical protein [Pseudoalteromonas citrea]TMP46268.1 hypothetical protein CWB97_02100 [Pseudoalteromonas citrea]TMP63044.1 hypothetical protein CWB96_00105 [Pseudoalteromonas citrea]
MAIVLHPSLLWAAERYAGNTANSYALVSPSIHLVRKIDRKPAMLLVLDEGNNILFSVLGYTVWHLEAGGLPREQHNVSFNYRSGSEAGEAGFSHLASLLPSVPALRFVPLDDYSALIRNAGAAVKAYIISDRDEEYKDNYNEPYKSTLASWPTHLWDGSTPIDIESLVHPCLEVSVGDLASDSVLRLTNTTIKLEDGSVKIADPYIDIYFANALRDWSTARQEFEALLNDIEQVSTTDTIEQMVIAGL